MTVTMQVKPAQALALQTMFEHWNLLSNIGSSRMIGFFVDGDGDFHPKCEIEYSEPVPELTNQLRQAAVVSDLEGKRMFDYDGIAWRINHPEMFNHE